MNERLLRQFDRQMRSWELLNAAGKQRDPVFLVEWLWGNSPLDDGKHAARFQEKLENKLAPLVLGVCPRIRL